MCKGLEVGEMIQSRVLAATEGFKQRTFVGQKGQKGAKGASENKLETKFKNR